MSHEVSTVRLYLMRAMYLLNFVLLGFDIWSTIFNHTGEWESSKGAAYSLWAALSLLSGLGLRYPLQMLPLLLFQLIYKSIWLLVIALPDWSVYKSADLTQTMLVGVVLDLIVIPWPYVFAHYVAKRGDRWRRKA